MIIPAAEIIISLLCNVEFPEKYNYVCCYCGLFFVRSAYVKPKTKIVPCVCKSLFPFVCWYYWIKSHHSLQFPSYGIRTVQGTNIVWVLALLYSPSPPQPRSIQYSTSNKEIIFLHLEWSTYECWLKWLFSIVVTVARIRARFFS